MLTDGRRVQTILVGDHTDSAELALWGNLRQQLRSKCLFTQLKVKIYRNKRSTKIEVIEQNVVEGKCNKRKKEIKDAQVIVVSDLQTFYRCISGSCRDGYVVSISKNELEPFGRCTECCSAIHLEKCSQQTSALLTIECKEETNATLPQ